MKAEFSAVDHLKPLLSVNNYYQYYLLNETILLCWQYSVLSKECMHGLRCTVHPILWSVSLTVFSVVSLYIENHAWTEGINANAMNSSIRFKQSKISKMLWNSCSSKLQESLEIHAFHWAVTMDSPLCAIGWRDDKKGPWRKWDFWSKNTSFLLSDCRRTKYRT